MDPDIDLLPFELQRIILDYRPRFVLPKNMFRISNHLKKKYCETCGEYINYPIRFTNRPPRHVHGNLKRIRYKEKSITYETFCPLLKLGLEKKKSNFFRMTTKKFRELKRFDIEIPIFLIAARKNYVQHFYNFRRLINGKSMFIIPMIDVSSFNIFENPDCFLTNDLGQKFDIQQVEWNRIIMNIPPTFDVPSSHSHIKNIEKIFGMFVTIFPEIIPHLTSVFIQFPCVLDICLNLQPEFLVKSLTVFTPMWVFQRILKHKIHLIKYISDRLLTKIFRRDKKFFIDLYQQYENANEYFEIYDPLEDTLAFRII